MEDYNYEQDWHDIHCDVCGEKMTEHTIEYNTFYLCKNKSCSEYGKWPEWTKGLQEYLKMCAERGSFLWTSK